MWGIRVTLALVAFIAPTVALGQVLSFDTYGGSRFDSDGHAGKSLSYSNFRAVGMSEEGTGQRLGINNVFRIDGSQSDSQIGGSETTQSFGTASGKSSRVGNKAFQMVDDQTVTCRNIQGTLRCN